MKAPDCPLCKAPSAAHLVRVDDRNYFACAICRARFLDPRLHPTRSVEKSEYDQHCNDSDDPAYRRFLSALFDPMRDRLRPYSSGLDYGCGPGPALAAMFTEAGHRMSLFDPIYAPDRDPLDRQYDFVTCSEVAEHFHHPDEEFSRLDRLLRPGAYLGVMTRFQTDDEAFAQWHYRRDPTHVIFYREETMAWIAARWGWTLEVLPPTVALFRQNESSAP